MKSSSPGFGCDQIVALGERGGGCGSGDGDFDLTEWHVGIFCIVDHIKWCIWRSTFGHIAPC
jgi:hypothetical protein